MPAKLGRSRSAQRVMGPLVACLGLCTVTPQVSAQEWPMLRHDPQRSGRAEVALDLASPTVRWRHYLGGGLRSDQFVVGDVDGDRAPDVVFLAGFKLLAKRFDDTLLWETPPLEITAIVGAVDLDGDGRAEVVATAGRGNVLVVDGRRGEVLWEMPVDARGGGSYARIADLNGDRRDDLYVGECLGAPHVAYGFSFAGGFAQPQRLFQLDAPQGVCGTDADVVADLDGDGARELVMFNGAFDQLRVFDLGTGALRSTLAAPPSGAWGSFSTALARNLDDDPAAELVVFTNGYAVGAQPYGARRVAVYDHRQGGLTLAWEANAPAVADGNVTLSGEGIGELDGAPGAELVLGLYDPNTRQWQTELRDALTGALRGRADASELVAVLPRPGRETLALVIESDRALVGLAVRPEGLVARWRVPAVRPLLGNDPGRAGRERFNTRSLVVSLGSDGAESLLVAPFDPAAAPEARAVTSLRGLRLDTGTLVENVVFSAPSDTTVVAAGQGSAVTRPYAQGLVVTSDGYMLVLDRSLASTNRLVGTEFTIPGLRVGGYYSGYGALVQAPIAGRVSDTESAVFVRDSRPALVRLDVRNASLASPPRVRFSAPRWSAAVLGDFDHDGARDLAAFDGRDLVIADARSGALRTTVTDAVGPRGAQALSDIVPLRRADRGADDLAFLRLVPGMGGNLSTFDARGQRRWGDFFRIPHSGFGQLAAADLTGDMHDDVFVAINTALVFDGRDGALAHEGPYAPYGLPIIAPFRATAPEVYLGGMLPDQVFGADLTLRGRFEAPGISSPWGALVRCEGRTLVARSPAYGSRIELVDPAALGPDGSPSPAARRASTLLAGGRAYGASETVSPGVRPGLVHNLTAVADLDATGRPALVAGATDGFLYALDACTLALRWAYDFRSPVGEAVIADADGDGQSELMVSVADGYLYALGPRTLSAPGAVRDVDPNSDADLTERDEVETFNTLAVAFDPVPGATRYQVRVLSAGGTPLQFPEYTEVTSTRAILRELPLRYGARYRVGVLALDGRGSSVEQTSDGVTVVDQTPPRFELRANPARFRPGEGETTRVEAIIADRTGVVATRTSIQTPTGEIVRLFEDTRLDLPSTSRTVRGVWDGINAAGTRYVAAGEYRLVVEATDVGGHVASASTPITLDPAAVTPARTLTELGGCTCRAALAPPRSPTPYALAALALALGARRRRRAM